MMIGYVVIGHDSVPYGTVLNKHVFETLAYNARIALHVIVHYGRDPHHITEAEYKAVARALRAAVEPDPASAGIPSTRARCDAGVSPRGSSSGALSQLTRTPGILAAFALVLLAFGGFSLLLPVVPLAVVRGGGSEFVAGATTGVFMTVTVVFQLLTPRITGVIGYRWVLGIGSSLLGLPSGLLALFDSPFAVLSVSGVRGAGFGMMTVAGSALVAELAPPGMLGRATSLIGLAIGISEAHLLPTGLWTLDAFGLATVA